MKPIERVLKALEFEEPDKVPLWLLMTARGATELGLSISQYFSSASNIVKGQLFLQEKYNHDCVYAFFYAAKEYEAFGGMSMQKTSGPPESGRPIFSSAEEILAAELPDIDHEAFSIIHETHRMLNNEVSTWLPILSNVVAPLSLVVMLVGFEKWIECIIDTPEIARQVVEYLTDHSIDLSNRYFEDGVAGLGYFNPVASGHILKIEEYKDIALQSDKRYFSSIHGLAAYALAGSRCESLLPTLVKDVKARAVFVSSQDDLASIKKEYGRNVVLIGNLNNISMTHWDEETADNEVKNCIMAGANGGGFILADHHGDISSSVPQKVIQQIERARNKWGTY